MKILSIHTIYYTIHTTESGHAVMNAVPSHHDHCHYTVLSSFLHGGIIHLARKHNYVSIENSKYTLSLQHQYVSYIAAKKTLYNNNNIHVQLLQYYIASPLYTLLC